MVAGAAEAKRVRVFAVGPKFSLSWIDTREHYRAHLLALVDARERATAPVQKGADDVVSHLLGGEANFVALPEDIGLMAALSGSRAAPARSITPETGGLTAAIGSLLGTYGPQVGYYTNRYPALSARVPQTRALALALTDTFGRVAVEVFAELADRYDVWLEAGVNMARDWRIVCRSRASYVAPPGGAPCDAESPDLVARLMTTDEDRGYAYEATTDQPVNMALIFGPDGKLVSKQVKTYLTPTELPGQLDLVPGHVSRSLGAVMTPVGTYGFVTSKDAWMPDVTARLDQAGIEVLVQPEFFTNDTVRPEGMWAPDNLRASGASDVQRHPAMRALVLPELTGNIYDFSADAQQHIVVEPSAHGGAGGPALVGQDPFPGWAKVQPWVIPEPSGTIAQRRKRLAEAGLALLPGSGVACPDPQAAGPCEGGHVEGVLWHDVDVAVAGEPAPARRPQRRRKTGPTPFTESRPIAQSRRPQRNVALASRGARVWAAFEEAGRLVVARSTDGVSFRRLRAPSAGGRRQWWPAIAVGPDGRVWLAWSDDATGVMRVYVASSRDGRRFGRPVALDATAGKDAAQLKPAIAATGRGTAIAAWIDERDAVAGETGLFEAGVFGARLRPSGPIEAGRRLDAGVPVTLAATLDHAWAPSLAVRGNRVLLAWLDFRTYDWRVWSRESADGGATFAEERAVEHSPSEVEAIADTPRAAFGPRGSPLLAFTDYRKRDTGTVVHPLYDTAVAAPGAAPVQIDPHGGSQVSTYAPAITAAGGRAVVAWQDHARGDADVRLRLLEPLGTTVRADDAGERPWNAWRPALTALARGRLLAAWEDDRDGPSQVFAARARVTALR